jgi:hypothetical protein
MAGLVPAISLSTTVSLISWCVGGGACSKDTAEGFSPVQS